MSALTCSVREAAELLGVSERHVYHLVDSGVIPKVPHLGRLTRIPRVAIESLVASALSSSEDPNPPGTTAAGEGNGAATADRSGKSSPSGRSTSDNGDGPVREHRPVEDSGALSAAEAG